jgi:hypothetical protein
MLGFAIGTRCEGCVGDVAFRAGKEGVCAISA